MHLSREIAAASRNSSLTQSLSPIGIQWLLEESGEPGSSSVDTVRAIHKNETNVDSQMNGELKEERETADEWLEVRDNVQSAVTAVEQSTPGPAVEEACTLLKEGEENNNIAE